MEKVSRWVGAEAKLQQQQRRRQQQQSFLQYELTFHHLHFFSRVTKRTIVVLPQGSEMLLILPPCELNLAQKLYWLATEPAKKEKENQDGR